MKSTRQYWSNHVEAIKSRGVTTSGYARQHGISLAALYYWQRKLQLGGGASFDGAGRAQAQK